MPPFLPRKRLASTPPGSPRIPPSPKRARLIDALDEEPKRRPALQNVKEFTLGEGDSSSESSLSDVDSSQFEDVASAPNLQDAKHHDDLVKDEEDIDWEDAIGEGENDKEPHVPMASGSLQLTFRKDDNISEDYGFGAASSGIKKGPTKRERQVRILTHRLHVQFLLYHNAIRNRWICDKDLQSILVGQLPAGIKKEVEKWRVASGLDEDPNITVASKPTRKSAKHKKRDDRSQRDWGKPSQRLEKGKPDLSHGDPLIPLMKVLSAYWKKRFTISAPGLRKRGYGTKAALQKEIESYRNHEHDPERHGERIRDLEDFKQLATKCEGSRDVGAQLFTALLRGLGIDSRLVANLQPTGFGWTKAEQTVLKKLSKAVEDSSSSDDSEIEPERKVATPSKTPSRSKKGLKASSKKRGNKSTPISLDTSSEGTESEDDDSVVDVTPQLPPRKSFKFDRDLPFPTYWTEVISPISNTILPVSPLVLSNPVATTPEMLSLFEPRGAKADKAKQVMAYVVAYSSDGTAKDVTVRYLKRRIWPGKTKGFRIPVEKVPIYNHRGKVKRYEEYDWFKTMMSPYGRTAQMRTTVDDVEESSDLVPQQAEKKEAKDEVDTLQSLKSSADFVLERFLRREEALDPDAQPVRTFTSGKGNNLKKELVYLRSDVKQCLTAESWHKEGRRPTLGAIPIKQVAVRAVTLTRKREVEEAHRQTGEKPTQGLYSFDQTELIIPPPIRNGVIPKNSYGNIDCFVKTMIPRGAVHIPLRGTVRICRKLDIDFAEAVTGFEFGHKRAVPVITGVVVAAENANMVKEAWRAYETERQRKEDDKLEKAVLALWRKFVMGLRIHERVQEAYADELTTDIANEGRSEVAPNQPMNMSSAAEEIGEAEMGGGFLLPHEDDTPAEELVVEHHDHPMPAKGRKSEAQYPTPISIASGIQQRRTRKSLLQEGTSSSSELSDLSDSADSSDEDDYEQIRRTIVKKKEKGPTKAAATSRATVAATRGKSRLTAAEHDSADDTEEQDDDSNDSDDDDDEEDDDEIEEDEEEDHPPPPSKAKPPTTKTVPKRPRRKALTSRYFDPSDEE